MTRTNSTASHQRATPFRACAVGLAVAAVCVALSTPAAAQVPDSHFTDHLYPALNEAGCRGCHTDAGVASGTRLHFPAEDASTEEVRAFGLRLAFLVDRGRPEQSLLFGKPTNRIKHTGGERVPPGSEAEALLLDWVKRLATLSDAELAATLESGSPRSGSGKHQVAMRRLTHRQYNNTVRALLGDQTRPSNQFPSEDFVHGFKNQSEGQSIPPLLAEAYGAAAEKLARNAFPRRRPKRVDSLPSRVSLRLHVPRPVRPRVRAQGVPPAPHRSGGDTVRALVRERGGAHR